MVRNVLLTGLALVSVVFLIATPSPAAGKKKSASKTDAAPGAVEKVLRAEVAGAVDRRMQLAGTLKEHPDSAAARWQAGFIKDGDAWRSFDQPERSGTAARVLDEYRQRREQAPQTLAGQLDLANWCRKKGLPDQEYAHLEAALAWAPAEDNAELLPRLGYRRIGAVWLSRENLRDWYRLNQQTEAALVKWEPPLSQILEGLTGSPRRRDTAAAALRQIKDPGAVPAIELILAGQPEGAAQLAVGQIRQIDGPVPTLALAKQAVFSRWPEVRKASTAALESRRLEDFVPSLLALLATPVKSSVGVSFAAWSDTGVGAGLADSFHIVLLVSYVLHRETADQFQVATFRTTNYLINEAARGEAVYDGQFLSGDINNVISPRVMFGRDYALGASAVEVLARERTVAEFNDQTIDLNRRIGTVLAAVSGKELSDAKDWWKWWDAFTDSPRLGEKTVVTEVEENIIGNPTFGLRHVSCFATGTPVWTEQGLVSIEKIAVGDRVLSKDIETGALAYRPVLKTTVRPPSELSSLRLADETIVCTSGHLFWSSGQGWVKARDLTSQTLLHTVTGNTPVWSVQKGQTGTAHNLVVADFHTYFVGAKGVLSQDLRAPRPTDQLVPGLLRAKVAAQK
jgi:hypothetical protein